MTELFKINLEISLLELDNFIRLRLNQGKIRGQ